MRPTSKSYFKLSSASVRRALTLLLSLSAGCASLRLSAQVTPTSPAANGNFGSQAIGSASPVSSFKFSINAGTQVGSMGVVTTGIANLDFANASGSTCAAKTYASATTCTINVQFTPAAAGLRTGAVTFFSRAGNAGTVLATLPIYGNGTGPQIAYGPGVVSAVDRPARTAKGLTNPTAVAVNAAGDLFVLDTVSNPMGYHLVDVPASGATPITTSPSADGATLYLPSCIAVDGAGNLYIGDFLRRIVVIPAGGGAATAMRPSANGIPMNYPTGLVVDGAGNLFVSDFLNGRVLEVPAGGGATLAINPKVNGLFLNDPHGLAVDGSGTLFIADLGNNRIVTVPANGNATAVSPTVDGMGLGNPVGVAVNGAGDLFIADNINHRVVKVLAGAVAATAISPTMYVSGFGDVYAVAVSGAGDLFMVQGGIQSGANIVEKIQYSQPPTLAFPTYTIVGSTDSTDGIVASQIMNIGNQPLIFTGLSYPPDFPEVDGDSNPCTASTNLNPGQACDLNIEFQPSNSGALSEPLTITDNVLYATGGQQSFMATGTAEQIASVVTPAPGTVLAGPSVMFTWTAGSNATAYYLRVGSTGVGSSNIFGTGKRTVTSWMVTGLPTNGQTLYVRLTTYFNNVQISNDYTYTAATLATLISPVSGTVLSGPTATFTWTPGTGATAYALWLGSTGVASNNLYSKSLTDTSAAVTGLPTNGSTIYARLYTTLNGVMVHVDYTFTAATQAALVTPTPASRLSGAAVTFAWTVSSGATGYSLTLGNTLASSNLYNSGLVTSTSVNVTGLPTNGKTIYARLSTTLNGVQVHTDYTYTSQ